MNSATLWSYLPDEAILRDKAREVICRATLPLRCPDHIFSSPSGGETCLICSELTPRDQSILEIEFFRPGGIDR